MAVEQLKLMQGIYSHLTADSTFNTAIGGTAAAAGRLWLNFARQDEVYPFVVMTTIDNLPMNASVKDGYEARVQFTMYDSEENGPSGCLTINDRLNDRLSRTAVSITDHEGMKPIQDITRGPVREDDAWRMDADWRFMGFED